jgi:predicted nucleotide-binding protein
MQAITFALYQIQTAMALKPDTVQFLLQQTSRASFTAFQGTVAQLFTYLETEIKDNPVYNKYESERSKWADWPGDDSATGWPDWQMPGSLDDAKSLAYNLYKSIATGGPGAALDLSINLFHNNGHDDNVRELNSTFIGYLAQTLEDIVDANPEKSSEKPKLVDGGMVFIIHGQDALLKTEVQLLMNRAGVQSVVLHEMPDRGRTIIENLVGETERAGYAIALLTPDDLTDGGQGRARQNVILEIGYFLGKLGKERLRMIVKEGVEVPSDLQGILYEKHDANGAWKMRLLKEMRAVGMFVDLQSVIETL